MEVTVSISSKVQKVFKTNLQNLDSPKVREAVIIRYLETLLSDDNLDLAVGQYLDSIEESGDLGDIIEEVKNKL